jgi:hypothetical protein
MAPFRPPVARRNGQRDAFTPAQHPQVDPAPTRRGPLGSQPAEGRRRRKAASDRVPGCWNAAVAVRIADAVGTMWCAYAFAALALVSLSDTIQFHSAVTLVSWISQTFLQLVLLSIIIVGQNVQAGASDSRAPATYEDADAVLHTALDVHQHLQAQDAEIEAILAEVRQLRAT